MIEISITISNEEQKFTKKFMDYDQAIISKDNPVMQKMIEETISGFPGNVDDVRVRISFST